MGCTVSRPACARPGKSSNPRFGYWNVTVSSASTAAPGQRPVAPSTPLGMSTATRYAPQRLTASMSAAMAPSAGRDRPVPSSASTTQAYPSSGGSSVRMRQPASCARR